MNISKTLYDLRSTTYHKITKNKPNEYSYKNIEYAMNMKIQ